MESPTYQLKLSNGEKLFIEFNGINTQTLEVNFYNKEEKKHKYLDSFVFQDIDHNEDWSSNKLKLTRMFAPFKREGIGTFILEKVIEFTARRIFTSHPNDLSIKDGSEITGDGIYFVNSMIKKGLIEDYDLEPED